MGDEEHVEDVFLDADHAGGSVVDGWLLRTGWPDHCKASRPDICSGQLASFQAVLLTFTTLDRRSVSTMKIRFAGNMAVTSKQPNLVYLMPACVKLQP